jgi:hypothetical protein
MACSFGNKKLEAMVFQSDAPSVPKRRDQRNQYLRILCALFAVAFFGVAAHGQATDQLEVKVPFEFVAAGKTLPAGNYIVSRLLQSNVGVLVFSSYENRASVFVIPTEFESGPFEKVYVTFERVGDQRFLKYIQTGEHLFTVPISHKAIMEAALKSPSGTPAAGGAAGTN